MDWLVGFKGEIKLINIYRKRREEFGIKRLIMIVGRKWPKIDLE